MTKKDEQPDKEKTKKFRVHELATELKLKSKDLLEILEKHKISVKSQLSSVDHQKADKIRKLVTKLKEPKASTKTAPAKKKVATSKTQPAKASKTPKKVEKKSSAKPTKAATEKEVSAPPPKTKTLAKKAVKIKPKPEGVPPLLEVALLEPPAKKETVVTPPEPPAEVIPEKEEPVQPAAVVEEKVDEGPPVLEEEVAKEVAEPEVPEAEQIPKKQILLSEAITVKDFAGKLNVTVHEVIKRLILKGTMATVNQLIDTDVAASLGEEMDVEIIVVSEKETEQIEEEQEDASSLEPRSPVVTIMGHVDHGKTSLLDAIRETKVVDKEAGGITQHIGAYDVQLPKGKIVFLDTPGHESFTKMRARGSKVTDIVVLVVAADDGVMPQTVEAIHHAEAAGVPILVAVNKIDKPNAQPDRIRQELANYDLLPEDWGGKTIYVDVSAKQKTGIENLLEMILLQAEIMELKANPKRMAKGTVIEAKLDKGRGPVATILIQKGSLTVGEPVICGTHSGKVRAMLNPLGKKIKTAGPSTPIEVLGLSSVPAAGESFYAVESERKMRQIANSLQVQAREEGLTAKSRIRLEDLHDQIESGKVKELNLILKTDVQGSIEALNDGLLKLDSEKTRVRIIHAAVGGITETDVMLAAASKAVVIGFNVRPTDQASQIAIKEKVDVELYTIIYNLVNDIKNALTGMLDPVMQEKILGKAEIRETFSVPKIGVVAGCMVLDGKINRNSDCRLIRDSVVIYEGKISSLRRFKDDVKEVLSGFECGIGVEKYQDIKVGDIIEPYAFEEVKK